MGNAGSVHNIHNDCVESELNSYCTQQYLRRTTGERRKKYNQIVMSGISSNKNVADCKVLPKPTENLKLRATTNGAILQAGGTISFRAKEQADLIHKNEMETFHAIRRSSTLILDGQNDTISEQRKSAPPSTEFRRSQTLLHVDYNTTRSKNKDLKNFDCSAHTQLQNTSTVSTLKTNKYNKKRKAPAAPQKIVSKFESNNAGKNFLPTDLKTTSLTKPRIYVTNCNKGPVIQKQMQLPTMKIIPFQRNSNTRTSVNCSREIHQNGTSPPPGSSKLPYRREKSFPNVNTNKLEYKSDRNVHDDNSKKKLLSYTDNLTANKSSAEDNYLGNRYEFEKSFQQEDSTTTRRQLNLHKDSQCKNNSESNLNLTNERKTKYQHSRIPQLKRTFYFGMESLDKSSIINFSAIQVQKNVSGRCEKISRENEDKVIINHSLEAEEEILDNGILVHVRPILPKRQPETPSFSPTAAWRNLAEEEQRLHIQNSRIIETPIHLTSSNTKENYGTISANWTPQQDLGDDDEEDDVVGNDKEDLHKLQISKTAKQAGQTAKEPQNYSNSLHIFSLSLPRDVHLQCTEQKSNLKPANCWLVPGFNSLQKFKPQLGKNIDFIRSNTKCTCTPNITATATATSIERNSCQLQNIFGKPSIAVESKSVVHQPACELNKASLGQTTYKNDNWLLHKSKPNDTSLAETCKAFTDSPLKTPLNMISLANFQPKSLTNICGGKHIVYLPGQNAFNASIKDSHKILKQTKSTKPTYARQHQNQEIVRQSLQDLTPIQNIHKTNVSVMEKSNHRFSFQSTVRVLEKRRLAEKLSKDAEIQEAQRLNELEAMKRVEEDFQRKRAPEKANLRNQLKLHLKAHAQSGEYRSLPVNINEKASGGRSLEQRNQNIADVNNNVFCRADPDGAVSPSSLDLIDNLPKITRHSNFPLSSANNSKDLECFPFDGEESESETQLSDLQCTALLIEPYLHSII